MKDFKELNDGTVSWSHEEGDVYLAIGKDVNGKRFRLIERKWIMMQYRNFYFARIYIVDGKTKKRTLLKTVTP